MNNKMPRKTIYINKAVNREGYLIECLSEESSIPLESVQVDYSLINKHHVLTESGREYPARFWGDSFGVAHNYRQVKKRLCSKALDLAERMARKHLAAIDIKVRGMTRDPNWRERS